MSVVVTWPRKRELQSYLDELARAEREGEWINFRVASAPKRTPARCYMVHSGFVRGWTTVVSVEERREGEVRAVGGGYWPAGHYIVREPVWHPVKPIEMRGFQGWRYFDREDTEDVHP